MKRIAYWLPAVPCWFLCASFVMCWGRERLDLFVFPFMQWLEAAWDWRWMLVMPASVETAARHPLLWFVLGAVVPTSVGFALFATGRRRAAKTLYGGVEWAGEKELSSGKITRQRF